MALVRSAVLASVFAGFLFACSSPEPTSLNKTDTADQADDDDDSSEKPSTPSKKSTADDAPAPTPAKTTPATTTTAPTAAPTASSSSGGIGSVLDNLPFKLSDLLALIQGAGNNNGGAGGFDLSGLFGGLFGNGGNGGADLGGLGGLGNAQSLLGAPDDSTGCCVGTQFFICGANATTCSNATTTCERAADLDDACAQ